MKMWAKTILSVLLGALFVYAGAIKLGDPAALVGDIEGYRLVPYQIAWGGALFLPPFEILCGIALWVPSWRRTGAYSLTGLMVLFLIALLAAWARGLDIQCGCFGKAEDGAETNFPWLVGRDLALLGGLLFVAMVQKRNRVSIAPNDNAKDNQ